MHIFSVLNIKICDKKKTILLDVDGFQTVSVLGWDEGYTVKYNPLPEGVSEGKAQGKSWRQRVIFDHMSRVES